ncbi:MAG: PP2C family serine/threonine-protein phosphatase [bacterium]
MSSGTLLLRVAAVTHSGRVRDHNEDTLAAGFWARNEPMAEADEIDLTVTDRAACLIADGMGGHAAGEVASFYAAARFAQSAFKLTDPGTLAGCLQEISDEIQAQMLETPDRQGMGTTIAGLLFDAESVYVYNVGDSRVYQVRQGFLRQLSTDHVPEKPAGDVYDPAEDNKPGASSSRLLQCLGGMAEPVRIAPSIQTLPLQMGTAFLICSDGLTDMVGLDALEACLQGTDKQAVDLMLKAALDAGGRDNVSIMIVRVGRTS